MTLMVVLILLLMAWFAAWRRHYRWSSAWLALGLASALLIGCGMAPRWLLGRLQGPYTAQPAPTWAPRNAIVLLTAGQVAVTRTDVEPGLMGFSRIVQTAALYHDCRQAKVICTVLVSGGDPDEIGMPLAQVYAVRLEHMGVAAADLQLEARSRNTWQNAQFTQPMLRAMAPVRVYLVTSGLHLRRAMAYFARFDVHPLPVRADYLRATSRWLPSATNFHLTDLAVHEYIGMARFRVYDAMGWNDRTD